MKLREPYQKQAFQKSSKLGPGTTNYPYIVTNNIFGQNIELNGSKHINDPQDKSLKRIAQRFNLFIQSNQDVVIFVEGGLSNIDGLTMDEAIRQSGERGLVQKLANNNGVSIESPEPPADYEVAELLKSFSPEQIMQHYFTRMLFQWYRKSPNDPKIMSASQYVESSLNEHHKTPGLETAPTTYNYYADLFAQEHGARPEAMEFDKAKEILHYDSSPQNTTSANPGDIRDNYIYAQLLKTAQNGHQVFMVYGAHHVFMYELALQDKLGL